MYSNVDTLLNKRTEFMHIVKVENPDIICLTEILPKHAQLAVDSAVEIMCL